MAKSLEVCICTWMYNRQLLIKSNRIFHSHDCCDCDIVKMHSTLYRSCSHWKLITGNFELSCFIDPVGKYKLINVKPSPCKQFADMKHIMASSDVAWLSGWLMKFHILSCWHIHVQPSLHSHTSSQGRVILHSNLIQTWSTVILLIFVMHYG